ncbi:hypothetical protein H0H81_000999, partial [Sphagnurus paluster]
MSSPTPTPTTLPEEILERILQLALPAPLAIPRPAWLRSPRHRLALLHTSRQLTRIATPLLYASISLTTPASAAALVHTLHDQPHLAAHVRALALPPVCTPAIELLRLCTKLTTLDLDISFCTSVAEDVDGVPLEQAFARALLSLKDTTHLTLRKPAGVYLSRPRPRALIHAVARAVPAWPRLSTVDIAFKLSDDTPTSPPSFLPSFSPFILPPTTTAAPLPQSPASTPSGPVTALTTALAAAPALHTFTTRLPSVWNAAILTVAANPTLTRVVLVDPRANTSSSTYGNSSAGLAPTGLFMMEARRHARLVDLIRAGTPAMPRTRAHTMGSPTPSPPLPADGAHPAAPGASAKMGNKREGAVGLGILGVGVEA